MTAYDPDELQREVVAEIIRRGYGIDWRPHVHLGLTRGTGKYRKFDGEERRESAGAITVDQWKRCVLTGKSVADIATQVIDICGRSLVPQKRPAKRKSKAAKPADSQADTKPSAPDVDPDVLELARVLSLARNPPKAKPSRGRPKGARARKKKGA